MWESSGCYVPIAGLPNWQGWGNPGAKLVELLGTSCATRCFCRTTQQSSWLLLMITKVSLTSTKCHEPAGDPLAPMTGSEAVLRLRACEPMSLFYVLEQAHGVVVVLQCAAHRGHGYERSPCSSTVEQKPLIQYQMLANASRNFDKSPTIA